MRASLALLPDLFFVAASTVLVTRYAAQVTTCLPSSTWTTMARFARFTVNEAIVILTKDVTTLIAVLKNFAVVTKCRYTCFASLCMLPAARFLAYSFTAAGTCVKANTFRTMVDTTNTAKSIIVAIFTPQAATLVCTPSTVVAQ